MPVPPRLLSLSAGRATAVPGELGVALVRDVNYREAKDLPASCFMDRQQPEPKVNLLVWPTYTYLHRS